MATYDPQRARMRGREASAPAAADDAAPAPIDLLLGGVPAPAAAVAAPVVPSVPEPSAAAPRDAAGADAHDHAGHDHAGHEHGPDCDHDHGGIDLRLLAGAGVAAALTVMAIVRARRRRGA